MRILSLTRYQRLGSSSRVRFYQYFLFLESHGLEIINAPFFDDDYVRSLYAGQRISLSSIIKAYIDRFLALIQKKDIELIWVEKEFLPWFPAIVEESITKHNIPYVVDYDDAVFHRYDRNSNPIIRNFIGHKIDRVMRKASIVIAGNDYIANRAREAGAPHVEILPSVVDVSQYTVKKTDADKIFKIGWIGSPVTAQYLDMVSDAILKLSQESDIRLILVGSGQKKPSENIPTELLSWNEELERTINQKFDVGIMPLVDSPFERGKCGYKLIQYMAGGLPVVASPVGINQQIVEQGVNGYFANTSNEWLDAFRTLRDNPQKRDMMGKAGRKKAETFYNLQVTAPKLLDLLKQAANQ